MATRSRTREFMRRRKTGQHAQRTRSESFGGSVSDDTLGLLGAGDGTDLVGSPDSRLTLPPEWVDDVEEAQEMMALIRSKMTELKSLHNKHINEPDFDNLAAEEQRIEIMTSDITSTFHRCQKAITTVGRRARGGSAQAGKVAKNVQQSLATDLQDMSTVFRKAQSNYLRRVRGREEQQKGFELELDGEEDGGGEGAAFDELYNKGFSEEHQAQLRQNTHKVEQREKEITAIVNSITELSTIFKDLAVLVVDQGTILDRIDYNLEQSSTHVERGRQQLEQGEKYQKKASRKLHCIGLFMLVILILFILVLLPKTQSNQPATTVAPANTTAAP